MFPRCEQFGFDRKVIDRRLAFLKLSKSDHRLAQRLSSEVIAPNVTSIIDRFYETLLFHAESRKWLVDGDVIQRLKRTQSRYLLGLGIAFDTEAYFEERLRIGVVHASIGLPLSTYQGAYANLIEYIMDAIPASLREDHEDYLALTKFIVKIALLDVTLATETYHYSNMSNLEDEVKLAQSREKMFQSQAETDSLTGLHNRKQAFVLLDEAIRNARLNSGGLCLLMLDLDHFKKINDTYGHQAGDEVLRQTGAGIAKSLRSPDIAGRYGGEEFIVGMVDITQEAAAQVAERIRSCIADLPIAIRDEVIHVTASIGLAYLNKNDDLQSLVKRTDAALYAAKESGRNRVMISQ